MGQAGVVNAVLIVLFTGTYFDIFESVNLLRNVLHMYKVLKSKNKYF